MGVGIFPLNETTVSISRQRSCCNKKQTARGQGQPGDGISSNSVMGQNIADGLSIEFYCHCLTCYGYSCVPTGLLVQEFLYSIS